MKQNLKELLQKADELRALFIFGQRVIPFLEEIFIFVSEIEPLLEEINISIAENLKKMPNASKQLSKVTEATELATTEIMDILDNLTFKTEVISNNLKKLQSIKDEQNQIAIRLLKIIRKGIQSHENLDDVLPEISTLIDLIENKEDTQFSSVITETDNILQSINFDSSSIMMSLQVQDITSQQLAAVNHLIETVQQKLMAVIDHFNKADVATMMEDDNVNTNIKTSTLHRTIAFDPDAVKSTSEKDAAQSSVDELIKQHKIELNQEVSDTHHLQDDIDKMFSGEIDIEELVEDNSNQTIEEPQLTENINLPNAEEETSTPEPEPDADDFESFSQDDIDALFGK
jgi:chemotaxis regulatin CheY-phosphate phosphatase CheZ